MSQGTDTKFVTVNVTKLSNQDSDLGLLFTCDAAPEATLADLRAILLDDGSIETCDKFLVNGRVVGRSTERNKRWAQSRTNGEIIVVSINIPRKVDGVLDVLEYIAVPDATQSVNPKDNLIPPPRESRSNITTDPPGVDQLKWTDIQLLINHSKLGTGINIMNENGPQPHCPTVIEGSCFGKVKLESVIASNDEVIVTHSARGAAFAKSGWSNQALCAKAPSINGGLGTSVEFSPAHSLPSSTVFVTGRALFSICLLALPAKPSIDKRLEDEVKAALELNTIHRRREELDRIWSKYGHVYIASVEMGGMFHTTCSMQISDKNSRKYFEEQMLAELVNRYRTNGKHSDDLRKDASPDKTSSKTIFEKASFGVVGGNTNEDDLVQWKVSLVKPNNWAVTRVLSVEPIIDLFDKEVRTKVREAMGLNYLLLPTGTVNCDTNAPLNTTLSFLSSGTGRLYLGLNALDFGNKEGIRTRGICRAVYDDSAKVTIYTWGKALQHSSTYSWLKVPTSLENEIQVGSFMTSQVYKWTEPQASVTFPISFYVPFEEPPKVVVWLNGIDALCQADVHISTSVQKVTAAGFVLRIHVWDPPSVHWAGVHWLAHDARRTDILSGSFSTRDSAGHGAAGAHNCGQVSFRDAQFTTRPYVFTALKGFHVSKESRICIRVDTNNVTNSGMNWHLTAGEHTALYSADAIYIAY